MCQIVSDSVDEIENGAEFLTKTTDLIESMETVFVTENDSQITLQLVPPSAHLSPANKETNQQEETH